MAKDWIDYANLGSNLFQNLQLSGVQDKLGALASAAASEQARAQQEDRLREVVFEGDTALLELRARPDDEKAAVLALATFTLAKFNEYHLTSACFRTFEDKARLRSVLEGFKALAKSSESGLSFDEKTEALLCARYMQSPSVTTPPVPSELLWQLGQAEGELSELTAAEKFEPVRLALSASDSKFAVPLVLVLLGGSAGLMMVSSDSRDVTRIGTVLCVVFGIVLVVTLLVLAVTIVAQSVRKPDEQTRRRMQKAAEAAQLRSAKAKEVETLRQQVDSAIAEQRMRLERERDALIAKVLKSRVFQERPPQSG